MGGWGVGGGGKEGGEGGEAVGGGWQWWLSMYHKIFGRNLDFCIYVNAFHV